jgi:hypothetical protein
MLLPPLVKLARVFGSVRLTQRSFNRKVILKSALNGIAISLNFQSLDRSLVLLEPAFIELATFVNKSALAFADVGANYPFAVIDVSVSKL